ncbi:GapR family DNA-binding domain-containing protein [Sinorhizobium fredii]|uniref:GapR family DNA-binding domain-containing protein n=1 Tax=Rhizobium fredii TaxID=380 RepID=UPI00055C295F
MAGDQLRAFIERIENLEEDKKAIADDIKDVYGEAKSMGFDSKALRAIVRIRKKDFSEYENSQAVLDTYLAALGMIPGGFDE